MTRTKKTKLSRKQLAVIDDIFAGNLDDQSIIQKNKLRLSTYNQWQNNAHFIAEFETRMAIAHRKSLAVIAGYATVAAVKLVQLTDSENQETARKACLDIISFGNSNKNSIQTKPSDPDQEPLAFDHQTAARLLKALENA
jgi:hypothetical protein